MIVVYAAVMQAADDSEFSWTFPCLLYWSLISLAADISRFFFPETEGKWVLFIFFRQRTPQQGRSFLAGCEVEYTHHKCRGGCP